ncbi:tRNA dihydrouridine(20/20a) synthase DusA [Roseitalea porphyridii]|uniref:tRNA-dihydrouridine(20/20a) synthase n=1 Tax=Roseitalea porphyridii TaxID=1852022 RepID=A0A4P6V374_9HYPH|nr:tRNA dihydrouridine(20/20a) synthase DusA [Roseitalea porphyridii]QBK31076.1 tRNA dihydrouridine(20/20a) synthase DusA [Roseitalea porphyridii]
MRRKPVYDNDKILAVAPMMDWTDRHCRLFHRQLSRRALLYTEMVVADAVIHGNRARLLRFDPAEHPLAVQLGGSDPEKLAEATRICADHGFDEINLNVGCPSDRVQSGTFGACLMRQPDLVARCVAAMKKSAGAVPVTVKCRIGVDDQEPRQALWALAEQAIDAGADALWVHARKAWLEGLSPKENRDVPPLDYPLVHALKADHPDRFIGINGGIADLDQAAEHLDVMDGVMLGRAAYQTPGVLADVDGRVHGERFPSPDLAQVVETMADHVDRHVAEGGRASHLTRHMVGLFHGRPGARAWRRHLSEQAVRPGATGAVLREGLKLVAGEGALAAA